MFGRLVPRLALRNLKSDWFGTLAAILGVALGTATVNVVLVLDVNTRAQEAGLWSTDPDVPQAPKTVILTGIRAGGSPTAAQDAKEETHEDYQVMRSAIRLGSLSAFLVGALIVFFTFRVVVEQRRREIALLRSIGATSKQVAQIFLLESLLVGAVGAAIGLFITPPMAAAAAMAGITTTGRSQLFWLSFPWKLMLIVATIGAGTAILGVLGPLKDVLRLDVASTLRPQLLDDDAHRRAHRPRGLVVIALPFMALLYVLIRPFFVEVLPSLAFFVFEAGLVCAGFLSLLVLVPEVVGLLGKVVGRILPTGPRAARLLTTRRIERSGHEFAWAVSGVMLVFALLLGLHLVTRALKQEVVQWADGAIRGNAYVFVDRDLQTVPDALLADLPPSAIVVPYSGRTPWPNCLMAIEPEPLARLAAAMSPKAHAAVRGLAPGTAVLSALMARRYDVAVGDTLRVQGLRRTADLEIVGITDVGYMPMVGPYRDSKTFGLVHPADIDLLAGFARPLGAAYAIRVPEADPGDWRPYFDDWLRAAKRSHRVRMEVGSHFADWRITETDDDFRIFDVILLLTGVLAGLGIANNLVLSAHVRRREIGLLRVLGMQSKQIQTLFLLEGLFIGVLGGTLAVVLGIPVGFLSIGALEVISAFEVQFDLPLKYPLLIIVAATLIAVASSVYPAWRASRASSADSVHYE